MRKLWLAASQLLLFAPMLMLAQSAFDGTWKIDLNNAQFPKKPDVYLLQNGMYECKTCVPPVKIKADGTDQTVTGHPYYDTTAIKVVSDHEIEETDKKNGKTVTTSKTTVSPDGNTLTFEYSDSSNSNAAPVTGKGEETRVAKGPAGSNAISGSWRFTIDRRKSMTLWITSSADFDTMNFCPLVIAITVSAWTLNVRNLCPGDRAEVSEED